MSLHWFCRTVNAAFPAAAMAKLYRWLKNAFKMQNASTTLLLIHIKWPILPAAFGQAVFSTQKRFNERHYFKNTQSNSLALRVHHHKCISLISISFELLFIWVNTCRHCALLVSPSLSLYGTHYTAAVCGNDPYLKFKNCYRSWDPNSLG